MKTFGWKLAAIFTSLLLAGSMLVACNSNTTSAENAMDATSVVSTVAAEVERPGADEFQWDEASATAVITLEGTSASMEGSGATVNGSTITITSAGTYVLRGTLTDGQVVVDAGDNDTVRIVLDGAEITCSNSAPIYSAVSGKTVIILADGTSSTLTDGETYTYASADVDEPDAALFAKDDMTIGGNGSLTVTANYNNGIGSKDNLVIAGGNITVNAANHAIRGRDSLTILDGTFQLTAGNDGLQSNDDSGTEVGWIYIESGEFTIQAAHDAIQAETDLTIAGGVFNITTAGGHSVVPATTTTDESDSYKGLKAGNDITISAGTFTIDSADDAVHGNGNVTIGGGDFTIATGDDGVHADGDLLISGGTIDITTSYEGLEGSTVTITEGEIRLVATDDGINAAGGSDSSGDGSFGTDSFRSAMGGMGDVSEEYQIVITGGYIEVTASGDGIDSNGGVSMSGGTLLIHGPSDSANGALDYELTFSMTGSTLIGAGSSGMAMAPTADSSTQPSLMVYTTTTQQAGQTVEIKNASGTTVASYTAARSFNSIVISTPDMADGETYTIYIDGEETGTVTLSGMLTSVDETGAAASGGMMGGGMMGGGEGGPQGMGGEGGTMPEGDFPTDGEMPTDGQMPGGGERPSGGPFGTTDTTTSST